MLELAGVAGQQSTVSHVALHHKLPLAKNIRVYRFRELESYRYLEMQGVLNVQEHPSTVPLFRQDSNGGLQEPRDHLM